MLIVLEVLSQTMQSVFAIQQILLNQLQLSSARVMSLSAQMASTQGRKIPKMKVVTCG